MGTAMLDSTNGKQERKITTRNLCASGGYFLTDNSPWEGDQVKIRLQWPSQPEEPDTKFGNPWNGASNRTDIRGDLWICSRLSRDYRPGRGVAPLPGLCTDSLLQRPEPQHNPGSSRRSHCILHDNPLTSFSSAATLCQLGLLMEKRSATRTNYLLTGVANVATDDDRGYRMIDVTARDVSAEGAYLYAETDIPPEPGQKVRVLLHSAPELKNSTMMFQATGVVVRLEDDQPEREPLLCHQIRGCPRFQRKLIPGSSLSPRQSDLFKLKRRTIILV